MKKCNREGYYLVYGDNGAIIKSSLSEAEKCRVYFKNCRIIHRENLEEIAEEALGYLDEVGTPFFEIPNTIALDQMIIITKLPCRIYE